MVLILKFLDAGLTSREELVWQTLGRLLPFTYHIVIASHDGSVSDTHLIS